MHVTVAAPRRLGLEPATAIVLTAALAALHLVSVLAQWSRLERFATTLTRTGRASTGWAPWLRGRLR